MRIHSDSYDPPGMIAQWMVRLAAFEFEIKHRIGKQHINADGMSRRSLLRCTQSEIRHPGAYETKRVKRVDVVIIESSTQTDIPLEKSRNRSTGKVRSLLPAKKEED